MTGTASGWRNILEAKQVSGKEILGSRWHNGKMIKEPFVTFWSPTLGKFFVDPTHFVPMPTPPEVTP